MCQGLLLYVRSELGNEQRMFDADMSRRERIGHRGSQVQEPKALGDISGSLPGFGRYLLNRVPGPFAFEQSAEPLRFLERMYVGPSECSR